MAIFTCTADSVSSGTYPRTIGVDMLKYTIGHTSDLALPTDNNISSDGFRFEGIEFDIYRSDSTGYKFRYGDLLYGALNGSVSSIDYAGIGFGYHLSSNQYVQRKILDTGLITAVSMWNENGADGGMTFYRESTSWSLTGLSIPVETWAALSEAGRFALAFAGNDRVSGTAYDDVLAAGDGKDVLIGGLGADRMHGMAGDDVYYVDNVLDLVVENVGGGSDMVFTSLSYRLGSTSEVEILRTMDPAGSSQIDLIGNAFGNTLIGNAGANGLNGGDGNDILSGMDGNDVLEGGTGADRMVGGNGDDTYYVDNAGDVIIEAAGGGVLDQLFASVSYRIGNGVGINVMSATANAPEGTTLLGNDFAQRINGNANANALSGRGGDDNIFGFGGNDALIGGLGNDILVGGAGRDNFYFDTALSATANVDRITDFNVADDTIRLENAIFIGLATGGLAPGAFNIGAAATQADDRIIYDSATGALFYDSNGNASGGATQFATLSPGLSLTHADFFIY